VYFGSVGVKKTRHALPCALAAEIVGVLAAIAVTYLFFGAIAPAAAPVVPVVPH
jgi:spore maturation protein SpmB